MKRDKRQKIGRYGLEVTQMGMGGAALGNLYEVVEEDGAAETIAGAYTASIRYFDTAPLYGYGRSENRLGSQLSRYNRGELVISTKVGYSLVPRTEEEPPESPFVDVPPLDKAFDFSRDAVLRSFEESLKRLQTDYIDILFIHDPDEGISIQLGFDDPHAVSHFSQAMDQVYPALDELRAQKMVKAIGAAMNQWQMLYDFAAEGDFDCFLLAGRYTLLEQEPALKFLPRCEEKNIRVVIGGPYNSGILATGAVDGAYYNYLPATPEVLDRTRRIQHVCARRNVSLQAAALQFPFGHPSIASVIPGARSAAEVEANVAFFEEEIPDDFWTELRDLSLIAAEAHLPISDD
ncbi:MAG: aldo/keto reductase [Candidatus Poribacteria bacterium]|nr:aldo/keto reductase [Candidatus Poribacteria bacterium]